MRKLALALAAVLASVSAFAATSHHVVVVAFENHSYSTIVGSSAMPYLNSLISQGALSTDFFANVPGSVGDYFMLTTGVIVSTSVGYSGPYTGNNLARLLNGKGLTWKVYAQSLPSVGYLGSTSGAYVKWHNPFAYFSDVVNSSTQRARIVPISQLSTDTANNTLPNFSLIVPDNNHNAHDCPTSSTCTDFDKKHAADLFLQQYLPALINTPEFQKDGVLVIWWDEGSSGDTAHGGGHVEVNLLGPQVKKAYRSGTFRQHQHVLRTITDLMGLAAPGAAANVSGMSDVFTTSSTTPTSCSTPATTPAIHICSPAAGSTVTSPVTISATARWDGENVTLMKAYVDGVAKCSSASKNLSCTSTVAAGTHSLTVNTWNSTGALIQAKSSFAVQ